MNNFRISLSLHYHNILYVGKNERSFITDKHSNFQEHTAQKHHNNNMILMS